MDKVAKIIDQTFLKKGALEDEIKRVAGEAKEYGFRGFCVFPEHTKLAKEILEGTGVKVTTLIDGEQHSFRKNGNGGIGQGSRFRRD